MINTIPPEPYRSKRIGGATPQAMPDTGLEGLAGRLEGINFNNLQGGFKMAARNEIEIDGVLYVKAVIAGVFGVKSHVSQAIVNNHVRACRLKNPLRRAPCSRVDSILPVGRTTNQSADFVFLT